MLVLTQFFQQCRYNEAKYVSNVMFESRPESFLLSSKRSSLFNFNLFGKDSDYYNTSGAAGDINMHGSPWGWFSYSSRGIENGGDGDDGDDGDDNDDDDDGGGGGD